MIQINGMDDFCQRIIDAAGMLHVVIMLFAPTVAACCCVFTLHILRTYLGFSHLCDVIFGYTESLQSALQVEVII